MISLSLSPRVLVEGTVTEIVLSATNVGQHPCTGLRLQVAVPGSITIVRGSVRLDLDRLDPGATEPIRLAVKAKQPGEITFGLRSFCYADGTPEGQQPRRPSWPVTVRPRPAGSSGPTAQPPPRTERDMVFVSYRRTDIGELADLLHDGLARKLGEDRVFVDAADIGWGEDFPNHLNAALERSAALVVVIGPEWNPDDADGTPRLHSDRDWVRHEVRYALDNRLMIFPVVGRGAVVPDDRTLPPDIRDLTRKNAHTVHSDSRRRDVADIVTTICRWMHGR